MKRKCDDISSSSSAKRSLTTRSSPSKSSNSNNNVFSALQRRGQRVVTAIGDEEHEESLPSTSTSSSSSLWDSAAAVLYYYTPTYVRQYCEQKLGFPSFEEMAKKSRNNNNNNNNSNDDTSDPREMVLYFDPNVATDDDEDSDYDYNADVMNGLVFKILSYLDWFELYKDVRLVSRGWFAAVSRTLPEGGVKILSPKVAENLPAIRRLWPYLEELVFEYRDTKGGKEEEEGRFRLTDDHMSWTDSNLPFWDELSHLELDRTSLTSLAPIVRPNASTLTFLAFSFNKDLVFNLRTFSEIRFPNLSSFHCMDCPKVTGDLRHLTRLSSTLEFCSLAGCRGVTGDFVAVFSKRMTFLEQLDVRYCDEITGNVYDIDVDNDFVSMKELEVGRDHFVYENDENFVQRVNEAAAFMKKKASLEKRFPGIHEECWTMWLDMYSEDYYDVEKDLIDEEPFVLRYKWIGGNTYKRLGWIWLHCDHPCDIAGWLTEEPKAGTSQHDEYLRALREYEQSTDRLLRGYKVPPPKDEFTALLKARQSAAKVNETAERGASS